MTPSPPEDAIHFRGKTLSPESPRPLHYPEPSSIPVLRNQMDPVFNDTATYQTHSVPVEMPSLFNFETQIPAQTETANQTSDQTTVENKVAAGDILDSINSDGQQGKGSYPMSLDLGVQAPDNQPTSSAPLDLVGSSNLDNTLSSDDKPVLSGAPPPQSAPLPSLDPASHPSSIAHSNLSNLHQHPSNAEQPTRTLNEALSGAINSLVGDQTNADVSRAEESGDQSNQDPEESKSHSLVGNQSPSTATAPSAGGITTAITSPPREGPNLPEANNDVSLTTPAGLPPRPPPQEKPSMHPNYAASDDIRTYHQLHSQNPNAPSTYAPQPSNTYRPGPGLPPHMPATGAPGTLSSNGLPPPPLATFQQPPTQHPLPQQPVSAQSYRQQDGPDSPVPKSATSERGDDEAPWGPEIQKKYDDFLRQERVYVTEGLWDRFPNGSRLFIGNLPTEKVTKRDLFHVFHRHGKLAQVSIKQAYGFVQFLDAAACYQALQQEQNMTIRGRKMHLEISKPQKNTRNAGQDVGRGGRGGQGRRSPDYRRGGQRTGGDRYDRGREPSPPRFSDFRDEPPRRRDDYRPMRSPSPRGNRGRGDNRKRDRSPDLYDGRSRNRSRSPPGRGGRHRSPSPRNRGFDGDGDLPFPRRASTEVPDVQIIISEELDRGFLVFVEKGFRDRSLRTDVLLLPPRVNIETAVRRQILEGVQAVVKLQRSSYYSGKIPLQVFDRTSGVDNVRYDEYTDLSLDAAAELVIRAKQAQVAAGPSTQYPASQPYASQYLQNLPQQSPTQAQAPGAPNITNLISNLDASGLQRLLGALQQQPSQPQQQPIPPQQQPLPSQHASLPVSGPTDLAGLLSTVARQQQNQPQAYPSSYGQGPPQPQQQPPSSAYAGLASNLAFANNPALYSLFSGGDNQKPPNQGQNPQNFMNPRRKWQ